MDITPVGNNNGGNNNPPPPPVLPDGDPSDSSSSSSSSSSSESTIPNIIDTSHNNDGNEPPSNHDEESQATQPTKEDDLRSSSKILKEMSKNASFLEFPTLVHHSDPERRKTQFVKFSQVLQYCTALTPELADCFIDIHNVTQSTQTLQTFTTLSLRCPMRMKPSEIMATKHTKCCSEFACQAISKTNISPCKVS